MGHLTTHVLDTAEGRPAAGLTLALWRLGPDGPVRLTQCNTNADGRCDSPLLEGDDFQPGRYELVFQVGEYFRGRSRARGTAMPDPAFLDDVVVRFGLAERDQHYHVPLLVSPYGYSTYRGS